MTVEVYADLLFLINAGMDGLCLLLTGSILHRRFSRIRVYLGAALGGIYAVCSLFLETGKTAALLADIGVCLLLCALVFAGKRSGGMRGFLSATAVYFLLSMTLGGIMTALYNLFNRLGVADWFPTEGDGPGTWLFALLALMGSGITLLGGRFFKKSASIQACRVTVELNGRRLELDGMVDTGNLLRDPLSGRTVICGETSLLLPFLSPGLALAIREQGYVPALSKDEARRIRLIPASTATGDGLLAGFLPDRVQITYIQKGRKQEREISAVIAPVALTATQALVPTELIE